MMETKILYEVYNLHDEDCENEENDPEDHSLAASVGAVLLFHLAAAVVAASATAETEADERHEEEEGNPDSHAYYNPDKRLGQLKQTNNQHIKL